VTTSSGGSATSGQLTPRPYPEELVEKITIKDGRTLTLRPIRADDDEKLLAFHYRLSADSIYCRYFSFHAELSSDEVHHLTRVDYGTRLALVLEDGDDLVGVARYERYPATTTAEVAFLVRDDYQHLGLGHRLFSSLAAAAWARGVTTFTAETLCRNHDMMSVFHHSGFPLTSSISAGQISVRMSIDPRDAIASADTSHSTIRDEPWS
jgi:GNAT superfamily N-acetyltransferase